MSKEKGLYDFVAEKGDSAWTLSQFVNVFTSNNEEVTIRGKGNSMLPKIDETCELVMEPVKPDQIIPGDVLLYTRINGQSVIHRVWRKKDVTLQMNGDNQLMIEKNVSVSQVVARVKKVIHQDGSVYDASVPLILVRSRYVYRYSKMVCRMIMKRVRRMIALCQKLIRPDK